MRFVLGKPCKGPDACWYLVLDCRKAEEAVAAVLRNNAQRFVRDPHGDEVSAHLALVSMRLAVEIDCGLHNRGGYYVNRNGGMCPSLVEIIREIEADTWPDKEKIETFRWPRGRHFYVKVDGVDLEWRGQTKWNTHEAATAAADAFIKSKERNES